MPSCNPRHVVTRHNITGRSFPALVLGVFWRRANRWGAAAGMLAGFGVALYYVLANQPGFRETVGITGPRHLWWSIQPIAAGLFGVPVGFVTMVATSLLTPPPSAAAMEMVDAIRLPANADRL